MAAQTPMDPILSALAHPLRQDILQRTIDVATTPADIAGDRGALGNVAYHVHILVDAGLLALQRTERRRGRTAHFYRRSRTAARTVRAKADALGALADALAR